eukprot:scaffold2844_cov326-Pavlova_lutheri.AAC.10
MACVHRKTRPVTSWRIVGWRRHPLWWRFRVRHSLRDSPLSSSISRTISPRSSTGVSSGVVGPFFLTLPTSTIDFVHSLAMVWYRSHIPCRRTMVGDVGSTFLEDPARRIPMRRIRQ